MIFPKVGRNDLWTTPKSLYNQLDAEFHFDFDPCPSKFNGDGLATSWGKSNFVNPPYSGRNIYLWLLKGIEESKKGNLSVFLLPSRTGSAWFHELILEIPLECRFLRGRVKFGGNSVSAPFDSVIVIVRPKCSKP